jgi:hypothetical protein
MDYDATSTKPSTPPQDVASETGAAERPSEQRTSEVASGVTEQSSTLTNDAGQIDVAQILAEVEALASLAGRAADLSGDLGTTAGLSALEREIEALLRGASSSSATTPIPAATAPREQALSESTSSELLVSITPAASESTNDFQELMDALDQPVNPMNETVHEIAHEPAITKVAVPPTQAFEEQSLDPMLHEIDEFLSESFEAQFARADGDVDRVLHSVFDPRALAGQEDDVNRALIEAFGSSRIDPELWGNAVISNPSPRFDGVVRAIPPEVPRHELDRVAKDAELDAVVAKPMAMTPPPVVAPARKFEEIATESMARKPSEYAGESPFVPAFPVVSTPEPDARTTVIPAMATSTASLSTTTPATDARVINSPTIALATVVASVAASSTTTITAAVAAQNDSVSPTNVTPIVVASKGPSFVMRMLSAIVAACSRTTRVVAMAPLRALSFPVNILPDSARTLVSVAAVTMVLWVPVAWWFAQKATQQPGVGPVVLVERAPTPVVKDGSNGEKTEAGHPEKPAEAAAHGAAH